MFIYMMIVLLLIIGGLYAMRKLRLKTTAMLEQVLYIEHKPTIYLELLRNPRLKLLYKRSTLLLFELDAYFILNNKEEIQTLITLCNKQPLTKGEKLDYELKKLSFYCTCQYKIQAKQTIDTITKLLAGLRGNQYQKLLKESEMIYQIYIEHDTSLIPQLEHDLKQCDGSQKGLLYYRLAKLYYFNHNETMVNECLIKASQLLRGGTWEKTVSEALQRHAVLEKE